MITNPQPVRTEPPRKAGLSGLLERSGSLARTVLPALGTFWCLFLLPFVRWFQIPSPFAAAFLPARRRTPGWPELLGMGCSLLMRLFWGLDSDIWLYIGCILLWFLLQACQPRTPVQASLFCLMGLLPRVAAACIMGNVWLIMLAVAALPVGMLATFLLRQGFEDWETCYAQPRMRERLGVQMLGLMLISALGFFRIGPVNLGHLCALVAVVLAAAINGAAYGTAAGLICALVLIMGGQDYRLAFPLCLCGLGCGLRPVACRPLLLPPVVLLSCLLAICISPGGVQPIGWITGLLGGLICAAMPRTLREKAELYLSGHLPGDSRMEHDFISQRIAHMQEAVEELARALPRPADAPLQDGEALGALLCAECLNREMCWGRSRKATETLLNQSMSLIRSGSTVDGEQLPALAEHGCLRAEMIEQTARQAMITQQKRTNRRKRARYEQTLTLTHLSAMSGTLGGLSALAAGESVSDLQAAHVIRLAIDELRTPAKLCYARRIDGHLLAALEMNALWPGQKAIDELLEYLSAAEDLQLSICRAERGRIELEETPVYSAVVGTASLSAGAGLEDAPSICGDACIAKRCEGGRMLLALCDGMGHGENAHQQSEKTLELLLLLLEAGYTRRQAITAVNGIMLNAGGDEETFTTVDLCDVDLWTGNVSCEKLGACATWVVRGDHLRKVEASSLPLGISEEATPCHLEYTLHSGDILVMISDGVADAFRDENDLKHAIIESLYIQPQRMADALLRQALLAGGQQARDDMTAMVLLMMNRQHSGGDGV